MNQEACALPPGANESLARALGRASEVRGVTAISGGIGNRAGAVLRVHRDSEPASCILKILRPASVGSPFPAIGTVPDGWGRDPSHSHYWRREALFYASALPSTIRGEHVRVPDPIGVDDRGEEVWVWLEDVPDQVDGAWSVERLTRAAEQLGGLHGHRAANPVASTALLPGALRAWVEDLHATNIAAAASPATWAHPCVQRALVDDDGARLRCLIADRSAWFDALARMSQGIVHLDAHRRNVLTADDEFGEWSVLIDWAYAGTGAIGEELGSLVGMTMMLPGALQPCDRQRVADAVFDAYLAGLDAMGWRGDEAGVRFAGHAACALQGGLLATGLATLVSIDADDTNVVESLAPYLVLAADLNHHFLWHADEARHLAVRMT